MCVACQARFSWVFQFLEGDEGMRDDMTDIFPGQATEALAAQLVAVKRWLGTLPLARRPLVKVRDTQECMRISGELGVGAGEGVRQAHMWTLRWGYGEGQRRAELLLKSLDISGVYIC